MLFTYNPLFRFDLPLTTLARQQQRQHLLDVLEEFGVDEDRVVYVGELHGETRTYVRESPKLVKLFFEHNGLCADTWILHDQGSAFVEDGESIFPALGFAHHTAYPPIVHQYLSINDNQFHGVAKAKWRRSGVDYSDDVRASVMLLDCLDFVPGEQITSWWGRNLLAGSRRPTVEEVLPILHGNFKTHVERSSHYQACVDEYFLFTGDERPTGAARIPHALQSDFNGKYWSLSLIE